MEYVISIIVMLAGVGAVLFTKGVLAARANGDKFNFLFFVQDNGQRLALAAFGIAVAAVIIFLDPLGWQALVNAVESYYSKTVAEFLRYGSPALIGIALGGASLVFPTSSQTEDK